MQSFLFTLAFRILALVSHGAAQCPPGYYLFDGNCDPCQPGYYCDGTSLFACDPGYCCGTEGIAVSFEINYKAPAGTYCSSIFDSLPAIACPADFYCPEGTQEPLPCLSAALGSSTCICTPTSCGRRLECNPNSECVWCTAGFFCAASAVPVYCPSGRCVNKRAVVRSEDHRPPTPLQLLPTWG